MDIAAKIVGDGGLADEDIKKSAKQLIQLTWTNITIKAHPPTAKCCGSGNVNNLTKEKIIIDDVHGTVLPGQFVAIIGASGK